MEIRDGFTASRFDYCNRANARLPLAHKAILERAIGYEIWVGEWVDEHTDLEPTGDSSELVAVISSDASLNAAAVYHALRGLEASAAKRSAPRDHNGTAAVALLGLARSTAAWRQLVDEQRVAASVGRACVEELKWLASRLESAIPNAR